MAGDRKYKIAEHRQGHEFISENQRGPSGEGA
jgi:hypothetical protein